MRSKRKKIRSKRKKIRTKRKTSHSRRKKTRSRRIVGGSKLQVVPAARKKCINAFNSFNSQNNSQNDSQNDSLEQILEQFKTLKVIEDIPPGGSCSKKKLGWNSEIWYCKDNNWERASSPKLGYSQNFETWCGTNGAEEYLTDRVVGEWKDFGRVAVADTTWRRDHGHTDNYPVRVGNGDYFRTAADKISWDEIYKKTPRIPKAASETPATASPL